MEGNIDTEYDQRDVMNELRVVNQSHQLYIY